ncbi:SRPBCC family protein [Kiloniella laminariae]|uniref:SRPBCC family protein n=1 Tax=Kiloniella laminariae TaxID=454162 RepID=UPI00037C6CCB|nr:SRPBCC family protein [Kiloniella laminariae]
MSTTPSITPSITKTKFVYVTYILSTPEKVFEALIKPEITRQYWAHENVSDWKAGSRWEHIRYDSEHKVQLAGKVVECHAPERLVITWAGISDFSDPSKHSRVTFELEPFDAMVRLTVTHDELEENSGMALAIVKGWPRVLSSLKSFLESGQPIDLFSSPSPDMRSELTA